MIFFIFANKHLYSIRPNLVIGFHGCDAETSQSLLNHPNKLIYSEKPYDWLGHGLYFRENNYDRSLLWAKDKNTRGVFTEGGPAFPGAGIQEKNHIQICIRNSNAIKGFFLPRKEKDFTPESILKDHKNRPKS